MEKDNKQRMKEKVNFFYREKCRVHVSKINKRFWRGIITNKKSEDVFEFRDDMLGNCLLFISDIYDINLLREAE